MNAKQELNDFVQELLNDAEVVGRTKQKNNFGGAWVDAGALTTLVASCRLLVMKLGPHGKVWDSMLQEPPNTNHEHFQKIRAVLQSIAQAIQKGRLSTIEEIVSAEIFCDLLEHAEELIRLKYYLPAAVILRAILEKRLRKLCAANGCIPAAQRPTIENFKQSLQAAQFIDKVVVKDIDWMASVGNAAAHQLPEFKGEDVPLLYQRITAFLTRFAVV